eukprot:1220229-Prorocentrum_lima.AAC.1
MAVVVGVRWPPGLGGVPQQVDVGAVVGVVSVKSTSARMSASSDAIGSCDNTDSTSGNGGRPRYGR